MRIAVAIDNQLLAQARALSCITEMSSLVREALEALAQRESTRRLARLGGSEPGLYEPPRRRDNVRKTPRLHVKE
jgi:hypothetical protein